MTTDRAAACLLLLVSLMRPVWAVAQEAPADTGAARRVAFDTVAGWQDFYREDTAWPVQFIVDGFAAVEVARGWQVSARGVAWRVRAQWERLLDQASVRYETRRGANLRFEAGKFPMPLGLGLTENRAGGNPGVLWCHRPYYMPVPTQGPDVPRVSLVSAVYPWGAQVAASDARWDLRAAVVDRPPVEFWNPTGAVSRHPNVVAGGGVTPRQGMRVGVAGARGRYADATATHAVLDYTTLSAETDLSLGYTRVSGEWVQSRFEAPGGTRTSQGWTAQAQHTITPRIFVHSRVTAMRSPRAASALATRLDLQRFRSVDSTLGYLVTPGLTMHVGHAAVRGFGRTVTDHQLGVSLIWAHRWW